MRDEEFEILDRREIILPEYASPDSVQQDAARSILLLETDRTRMEKLGAVLTRADYRLTVAFGLRELFEVTHGKLDYILISDTLGNFALPAAAETARRRWPEARIVILGVASSMLEDNFYDDALKQPCTEAELLGLLKQRANPAARRAPLEISYRRATTPSHVGLAESDPSKLRLDPPDDAGRQRTKPASADRRAPRSVLAG